MSLSRRASFAGSELKSELTGGKHVRFLDVPTHENTANNEIPVDVEDNADKEHVLSGDVDVHNEEEAGDEGGTGDAEAVPGEDTADGEQAGQVNTRPSSPRVRFDVESSSEGESGEEGAGEEEPGEELWTAYLDDIEVEDKANVKEWAESSHTSTIFAGVLFLVTSYFAISASHLIDPQLSGEPSARTVFLLSLRGAERPLPTTNAAVSGNLTDNTPSESELPLPSKTIIAAFTLWCISLVIALTCALWATAMQMWAENFWLAVKRRRQVGTTIQKAASRNIGIHMAAQRYALSSIPSIVTSVLHFDVVLFLIGIIVFLYPSNLAPAIVMTVFVGLISIVCATYGVWEMQRQFRPSASLKWWDEPASGGTNAIPLQDTGGTGSSPADHTPPPVRASDRERKDIYKTLPWWIRFLIFFMSKEEREKLDREADEAMRRQWKPVIRRRKSRSTSQHGIVDTNPSSLDDPSSPSASKPGRHDAIVSESKPSVDRGPSASISTPAPQRELGLEEGLDQDATESPEKSPRSVSADAEAEEWDGKGKGKAPQRRRTYALEEGYGVD